MGYPLQLSLQTALQNLFKSLAQSVSQKVQKIVYCSFFHSHLRYAILIWGHCSSRERVFRLQRKAIRILGNVGFRDDCKHTFIKLQILTFPCEYILEALLYIKRNVYNFNGGKHEHNTRTRNNLVPKYSRLSKSQNSANYTGVKFYNLLPPEVQQLPFDKFKFIIRKYLLERAFYSYEEFLSNDFSDMPIE